MAVSSNVTATDVAVAHEEEEEEEDVEVVLVVEVVGLEDLLVLVEEELPKPGRRWSVERRQRTELYRPQIPLPVNCAVG